MHIGLPIPDYIGIGKAGGIETYSMKLVECLQDIDKSNEYLIFCSSENEDMFRLRSKRFRKVLSNSNIKGSDAASTRTAIKNIALGVSSSLEQYALLRGLKNRLRDFILKHYSVEAKSSGHCDIIHHMYTVFPFWLNYDAPVILTMHDIQQEYFPEFFTEKELEERRACFRPSADKADHIIAISAFTKKTLMEKYDLPDEKISVVYNGYDQDSFKKLDAGAVQEIRAKYHLPDSFLFYPSATWPHKNHLNLVRAYRILKDKYNFRDKLILCGIHMQQHAVIEKEIERLNLSSDVIYIGYVPYADLPRLFNAATLMVYPSFFEGFGIPLIEAMATELPVVCSNSSSLPEVAGAAALLFDPHQPEDIAEKISLLHNDANLIDALISKGLDRIKNFTWKKTAEETLRIYTKIYDNYRK